MNLLRLSEPQAQTIIRLATDSKPAEVCGLLVGNRERVCEVIPIQNIANDPGDHYVMDSSELAKHLPIIGNSRHDLIGFYHSHPQSDPVLSVTDQRESFWQDYVYLVIGLKRRHPHFAAWKIHAGKVLPVQVQIGDNNRPNNGEEALTKPQRIAIIVGGLVALLVMLILSLNLLPPAPPIP